LEKETFILKDLFCLALSRFKKYQPSGNLKFIYLRIFQSLKLHILVKYSPKFHSKYFGLL